MQRRCDRRVDLHAAAHAAPERRPAARPAEGDAPVPRGAGVVEERASVADGLAAPPELFDDVGDRLGDDEVAGPDEHPTLHRPDARERATRGEDRVTRADPRTGRLDGHPGALPADAPDVGVFVQAHATLHEPPAQPERQTPRMDRRAVGSEHAAPEDGRVAVPADLLRGEVDEAVPHPELLRRQRGGEADIVVRRGRRDAQLAAAAVPGVDTLLLAPAADVLRTRLGRPRELERGTVPQALAQWRQREPVAVTEAAVAPARAVPAQIGLQQDDPRVRRLLGEVPRAPHPRVAATDDRDVGGPVTLGRRLRRRHERLRLLQPVPPGGVPRDHAEPFGSEPTSTYSVAARRRAAPCVPNAYVCGISMRWTLGVWRRSRRSSSSTPSAAFDP